MTGALLSEVWPDMVTKPKKSRRKKKTTGDILDIPPLTPQEMETELLEDNQNSEQNPERKLRGMRVSPYTEQEKLYQDIKRRESHNVVEPSLQRYNRRDFDDVDDPEYREFLEFKQAKSQKERIQKTMITPNEQFNELLLYVFTGFFLLMIYDGIYKLGKNQL